ncbi:MAG: ribose-phosphate pyrophosphokinase [Bacillati bacterium ANGP1]|uniref:ribose-phosphate diphosphokinase n=1 Tax=Candidatus Segetimicrobium genomatis TaxID=2569760 RepID=A0A537J658_9BACT|nr:MAG: ribose-phosphate pyrophosphokinase [Terrabacteria group bacterium ANGP1]
MTGAGIRVFSGTSNPDLTRGIAAALDLPLGAINVFRYAADAFVLQSTSYPANDHLMELLIIIDALRRASARRITAVIPYFGYARQDRKIKPREPISAKLVANLLTTAGAHRVVTLDLHAGQMWGFFDIPLDHLPCRMILGDYFRSLGLENLVVVSPDIGGVKRAREFAEYLQAPLAIIDKRRDRPNQVADVVHVIGKVYRRTAILVDDIIDTGGTVVMGAEALVRRGVREVYACCTHAILSPPAVPRVLRSAIRQLVVTDSIPVLPEKRTAKTIVLSVSGLLAEAIRRIHADQSVSELFTQSRVAQPAAERE